MPLLSALCAADGKERQKSCRWGYTVLIATHVYIAASIPYVSASSPRQYGPNAVPKEYTALLRPWTYLATYKN